MAIVKFSMIKKEKPITKLHPLPAFSIILIAPQPTLALPVFYKI